MVILNDAPSENTIKEAAMLAGYFSKAGNSGQIPVDYTEIRHVHKPSGAKPGFVTYDHQKHSMLHLITITFKNEGDMITQIL